MKNRRKRLTALLVAVTMCSASVYAESDTVLIGMGAEAAQTESETESEQQEKGSAVQSAGTDEAETKSEQTVSTKEAETKSEQAVSMEETEAKSGQTADSEETEMKSEQTAGSEETERESGQRAGSEETEMESGQTAGSEETEVESGQTAGSEETESKTEQASTAQSEAKSEQTETAQNETKSEQTETAGQTETKSEQTETSSGSAGTETSAENTESEKKNSADKKDNENDKTSETESALLIVKTEEGKQVSLQKINGPEQLSCDGKTYAVDYEEGVYRIQVPEETKTLQITVPDQTEEEKISLTKWSGYLAEVDQTWLLCPDDPMEGAFEVQGNTYTADLEKFGFEVEEASVEQLTVYGDLTDELSYAEIFVYSEERSEVLLIEFISEEAETDSEAEYESELESDTEAEYKSELESGTETEYESEPESGAEAEYESELESGTETEYESELESGTETEYESELIREEIAEEELTEMEAVTLAASQQSVDQAYSSTGQNLADSALTYTPTVASINGEWQILGLARSGQAVDESVYSSYLTNVVNTLVEKDGVLHKKKYTDYSRVILALTALGEDVMNVAGYNLLQPLSDFDQTVWQGVNGAIFALLAFDSHNYEIPTAEEGKTQTTRENLIEHILGQEISGGGWDLSGKSADPDMTAMAIQALAPYYSTNTAVKSAVDRGIEKLSSIQESDGSFATYGSRTAESCAQVIVALTALGIDPNTDSRFVKNGCSVVDALLGFAQSDGSFKHVASGSSDQMATEQAYYALTAYQRFVNGENSLYDMTDVPIKSDYEKAESVEELIKALPDDVTISDKAQIDAANAMYNSLNETQKGLISSESTGKLQSAVTKLAELEEEQGSTGSGASGNDSSGTGSGTSSSGTGTNSGASGNDSSGTGSGTSSSGTGTNSGTSGNNSSGTGSSSGTSGTGSLDTGSSSTGTSSSGDKVASGTTKQVNLVSNRTGSTSTGTSSSGSSSTGTGSTSTGTSTYTVSFASGTSGSSTAEDETENETESENSSTVKSGGTKSDKEVTSLISDINALFRTSKTSEKLPENPADYTDVQISSIVAIYRTFLALDKEKQQAVEESSRYQDYLEVLDKLKAENHYDEDSATDLRDNEEEVLPWYIQMEVSQMIVDQTNADAVKEALKGQGEMLTLSDISLIDLLEGGEWQPEDLVRVSIPAVQKGEYDHFAIVHLKEDGGMEFIEAHISGLNLEFDTDHFSKFGIVGYNGSMEELMADQDEEPIWIYLIPGAGAAAMLVMLLIIRICIGRKKRKTVTAGQKTHEDL